MEKTLLLENIINKINKNVEDIKTKLMQLESKLYNDVNFDYKTVLYFTNILTEINETLSILSSLLIEFINIYKTNDIMQEFSKTVELKITELKDKILILETRLDNFKQLTNKSIYDVKETIENIESQIEMFEKDFKQTIQLID
ncbi:MAG: hypothetical protein N2505_07100, partial [Endomicrobia bacterium]|nr:hypothetical protein [Endomicrobiia bacterium]